jgi:hypothetical protein
MVRSRVESSWLLAYSTYKRHNILCHAQHCGYFESYWYGRMKKHGVLRESVSSWESDWFRMDLIVGMQSTVDSLQERSGR